jgi:hypothetical protein
MSTVYMINARAKEIAHSFVGKLEMLLDTAELGTLFSPGQAVVIKVQIGDVGNISYLRPVIIRALVEKVLSLKGMPVVTDSMPLVPGCQLGLDWFNVATAHGFATNVFDGVEMQLADGYTGVEGEFFPAAGQEMGSLKVARIVKEARVLFVLSHVTGHPLAGLGGALVSLGLGCLALQGKEKVHEVLKPQVNVEKCSGCGQCVAYCPEKAWVVENAQLRLIVEKCSGCGGCLAMCPPEAIAIEKESNIHFQKRVVEAATTVMRAVARVHFLNFLVDVRPQPDDYPFCDNAFVPDLGVLMSDDPVAIDQASLDLINRAPGLPMSVAEDCGVLEPGQDKIPSIVRVDPAPLIHYGEEIGLGESRYRLLIAP